jgi:hypothetical protein
VVTRSVPPMPESDLVKVRVQLFRKENFNEEFSAINGDIKKGEVITLGENEAVLSFKLSEGVSLEGFAVRRNRHNKKRYETITISGPAEIADVRKLGIKDEYNRKYGWINNKIYVMGKKVGETIATLPGGKKVSSGVGGIFG